MRAHPLFFDASGLPYAQGRWRNVHKSYFPAPLRRPESASCSRIFIQLILVKIDPTYATGPDDATRDSFYDAGVLNSGALNLVNEDIKRAAAWVVDAQSTVESRLDNRWPFLISGVRLGLIHDIRIVASFLNNPRSGVRSTRAISRIHLVWPGFEPERWVINPLT